jgi:hypothetical protein
MSTFTMYRIIFAGPGQAELWELPLQPTDFRQNSIFGNLEAALRWLGEGHIRMDGLYSIASPGQAQEVYQEWLRAPGRRLTALFDWMAIA